jgi:phosphoglycolate phosphatase-like HAD superfamily hydrolase
VERIQADWSPCHIGHALFDFDGTLSLIRQGWQDVMAPMMRAVLLETPRHEPLAEVERLVRQMIDRTTGKQTIFQMMDLQEMVAARGGQPLEAAEYKRRYLDLLWQRIAGRVEGLKVGSIARETLLVSGAESFLAALVARGVTCYLASGTDIEYVRDEAQALGLDGYFHGQIYGAVDDWRSYSKAMIIERILQTNHLAGSGLATFGDGYVEIENTVAVGGIAVGVATDEVQRHRVDPWKRQRLIDAGAQLIIADFCHQSELLDLLVAP